MGSKLHPPLLPMETAQEHNLVTQEGDGDDPAAVPGDSSSCKEAAEDPTMSVHGQAVSSSVLEVSSDVFANQTTGICDDQVQVCDQRSDTPELTELFTVADLEGGGGATDLSEQVLQLELSEGENDVHLRTELASEAVLAGELTGCLSARQVVSHQTDTTEAKEIDRGEEETVVCTGDSSEASDNPVCLLGESQAAGGGVGGGGRSQEGGGGVGGGGESQEGGDGESQEEGGGGVGGGGESQEGRGGESQEGGGGEAGVDLEGQGATKVREEATGLSHALLESSAPAPSSGER